MQLEKTANRVVICSFPRQPKGFPTLITLITLTTLPAEALAKEGTHFTRRSPSEGGNPH